jgi:putative peptide zinc metalloprotease protein
MPGPLLSDSWYRVRALIPQLRAHAQVGRHQYRGETWYVLRDASSGRVHRFSPASHTVISLMNGSRTVEQIWERASEEIGDHAPTQDELIQLLAQLHASDVLLCDVPPDAAELFERSEKQASQRRTRRWLSPLAIQIPLLDPERFLERMLPYLKPLFGWAGALAYLAVVLPAPVLVALHWPELTNNFLDRLFTPDNLFVLWLIFPVLKVLHEFGHGFAAKAFGGEVHEMGVMLLVFTPVPYVDAPSTWTLASKYQRAIVGAGGVIVELFVAALALHLWVAAEPGAFRAAAYSVLLIGGLTTLLFNGNPLLRFDGYYVLSDLIEIPNLRVRANRYVAYLAERWLLGNPKLEAPHTAPGEATWLTAYSVSAFVYRLFVVAAILLFVLDWNFVLGVALGTFAIVGWFGVPLYKIAKHLIQAPTLQPIRGRALAISGGILAFVLVGVALVPFPLRTRAEAVVWIPEEAFVRAETSGFLEGLVAADGAMVQAGDLLIQLSDPFLSAELEFNRAIILELEAHYDAVKDSDLVEARIVQEKLLYARKGLARVEERVAGLEIRSQVPGRFVVPRSEDLPGRYVRQGQLVAYVVDIDTVTLRAVVPQEDIDLVRQRGRATEVRLAERLEATHSAIVKRIVPGASKRLPSVALGIGGGGDVIVDPSDAQGDRAVETMFEVELELEGPLDEVHAGGRVYVRFDHGTEALATQWYRRVRQLFLTRFEV